MKKAIAVLLAILMALALVACGEGKSAGQTENAQIPNPWREITAEEVVKLCVRLFSPPEGATEVRWSAMESDKKDVGQLVQLNFKLDGQEFTARARQGAAQEDDISGLYVEWGEPETVTLANWGEGNMEATIRRGKLDDKNVVLCSWYDVEIGICYTLSVDGKDLPADFNIQSVAESLYDAANEPQIP